MRDQDNGVGQSAIGSQRGEIRHDNGRRERNGDTLTRYRHVDHDWEVIAGRGRRGVTVHVNVVLMWGCVPVVVALAGVLVDTLVSMVPMRLTLVVRPRTVSHLHRSVAIVRRANNQRAARHHAEHRQRHRDKQDS